MRSRSLLFGAALALTVPLLAAAPAGAILSGHASTQAYSFMGSFQPAFPAPPRPDGHGCGVTVLAPQWALTASHCAGRNPTGARNGVPRGWRVRIGSLDTTSGGEVADVDHYYRLATSSDDGGFWGKDVALLHLRHPVRARPARIAAATPPEGAPVRILGWGMSCEDSGDPACFPTELREADTVVQPLSVCPVAGVVSGPGGDRAPTLYTDVTRHAAWINGIISGTRVPPDDRIPDVEGAVDLGGCVGSVVSTPASRPRDPALLLPHGHCVTAARPAPGTALVDQPAGSCTRR